MKLNVEVMSKDIIKPSIPTSDQFRRYRLSFLDQISPPVYNPLILFYRLNITEGNIKTDDKIKIIDHLKQSLSDVLTYFYPLAGRIKDNMFLNCNDEGVPFSETRVQCKISDVLDNPVPDELNKLLLFVLDDADEVPFGVQFNVFGCGGFAIGVCISHKIADALSFFTFLKTWAAVCRGDPRGSIAFPEFVSAELFPPKTTLGFEPRSGISTDKIVTKRFVFTALKIQEIKANIGDTTYSSRIAALSAFIWTRFIATTQADATHEGEDNRFYAIVHAVNLRKRFNPPLPDHSFGNLYQIAMTILTKNSQQDCRNLVNQIGESIRKIDAENIKRLRDGSGRYLEFMKEGTKSFMKGEMITFNVTSLCNFPIYEVDFGWGKPAWVGSAGLTFKNLVVFMDTINGDGIEAWISLKEEEMGTFENDEIMRGFVVS
ncbi:hypothetical protein ES332_D04G223000v1 [Gossypium tomentosum]|uniref:Vinorine synthase-like n=1 Tax=Gossypium tomentosum TaxID=34277 RepID=A0A5D2LG57_GOSTO|nr:hypothetical protein ES332_D04G223000v1 [Gossypium tomentosum]